MTTSPTARKVCVIGGSGKLGIYLIEHLLAHGDEVVAVCREKSVDKLERFRGRSPWSPVRPTTGP